MSIFKNKIIKVYGFPIILLISVLLGSLTGFILKENASVLKPFGDIFLNLMYTIVIPLVFFTIANSIASMTNMKRLGKILKSIFSVFVITSLIASVITLITVLLIDPIGTTNITMEIGEKTTVNIGDKIVAMLTVTDFSQLLNRSNMFPLIIFSIIFGISVNLIGKDGKPITTILDSASKVMMKIIKIIMYYAPIGIFAYFASLIGEFGPGLLGSYAKSMSIYYILCVVYFLIFYTLYAYLSGGKLGIKTFYKNCLPSVATSLATQSSMATLPTNFETTKNMNIPKDIRDVSLPLGVGMHMEGTSMGTILKIVFLFGIFGKDFAGLDTYMIALFIALLSGVVMSGIPGGGLIAEMLIVTFYGFPLEAFPIIATIGWLIDPPATCLNATGDTVGSMLITRLVEGKNWLKQKLTS